MIPNSEYVIDTCCEVIFNESAITYSKRLRQYIIEEYCRFCTFYILHLFPL